jgi:hypothetical protein
MELNPAEGDGVLNAERSSGAGDDCPQEVIRVEFAAQAVEVGLCARSESTPAGRVLVTSTPWVGSRAPMR